MGLLLAVIQLGHVVRRRKAALSEIPLVVLGRVGILPDIVVDPWDNDKLRGLLTKKTPRRV